MNTVVSRIISLLALILIGAGNSTAKTYLLTVGISRYKNPGNNLKNPANDAKTIKWIFDQNGNSTTLMLLDHEATFKNVEQKMAYLFSQAKPQDTVIFYFSGHGQGGSFMCYNGYLNYATILSIMKKSKAKRKMVFADACFAGKIREMKRKGKKGQPSGNSKNNTEVFFFLSSRSNETSADRTMEHQDMKNGVFTTFLQRGLRGGADANKDRTVTAIELFRFVSNGVKSLTHDKQHPTAWGRFDNNMPIISW